MTTYVSPFTSQAINPSQVGYEAISISVDTELQWPINGNTSDVVANIVDVTATVGALKLYMPPAVEVSTGQSTLIRNVGAQTFTVVDQGGNTITSIASGVAKYIFVRDNTTINGVWASITFGSGTSAANAADLAGYGLKAILTTLNTITPVVTFSANVPLSATDQSSMYVWTGGAGTVTLPPIATLFAGWFVILKNDGTGTLNVATQGADTIDGQISAQLQIGESFVIVCSGSNFYSYGYGQSAQFVFTQLVKNVTGGTVTLTALEAASVIQEYKGALVSNCTVVVPQIVQFYSLRNTTSGAFTLTFTTGVVGGTTLVLPQNQTVIAICDGTNVYNAQTATGSFISQLTLGNGSPAAPSLNFVGDLTSGIYLPASNQLGFVLNGNIAGRLTTSGLLLPVGINGGAF